MIEKVFMKNDPPAIADVKRNAQIAFDAGNWPEAEKLWSYLASHIPPTNYSFGEAKLHVHLARRMAQLDEERCKITAYQQARKAVRTGGENTPRIAVYSAIVGHYDSVKIPGFLDPRFDYILFSDVPVSGGGVWQIRPITVFDTDDTRTSRYVKMHPHVLLNDYDLCIWVDANIMILDDISSLLAGFLASGKGIGAIRHPSRSSVYEEILACIDLNKDDPELMRAQIERYRALNFEHDDLVEANFLFYDLHNLKLRHFLQFWWNELEQGSRRDQLSFNYALRKAGLDWHRLLDRPFSARHHDALAIIKHDQGLGSARRLVECLDALPVDPYQGSSYSAVKAGRMTAVAGQSVDILIVLRDGASDFMDIARHFRTLKSQLVQRIWAVDLRSDLCATQPPLAVRAGEQDVNRLHRALHETATQTMNRALAATAAPFVIVVEACVRAADYWADKLLDAVTSTPSAGLVVPLSGSDLCPSFLKDPHGLTGQTTYSASDLTEINLHLEQTAAAGIWPIVPLASGLCFGIQRQVLDTIGRFDELLCPNFAGCEVDYGFRSAAAGYATVVAMHTYVSIEPEHLPLHGDDPYEKLAGRYSRARLERAVRSVVQNPILNRQYQSILSD